VLGFAALLSLAAAPWPLVLTLAIGLGLVLGGVVFLAWPAAEMRGRLIDLAWTALVPEILDRPLSDNACRFVGALSEASYDQGSAAARREAIEEVVAAATEASVRGAGAWGALAAVWRLHIADLGRADEDPVPALVELLEQVFAGAAPARVLGPVLAPVKEWPRGRLLRLQAILTARATELGLELADIVDLARVQPALAPVLGIHDLDRLAQLRLFWRMQSSWPRWLDRATNVFELARRPSGERELNERGDLLLLVRGVPIYVGTRGVWLKDVCLTSFPGQVEVVGRRHAGGEGFEIVVGSQRVWFNTQPNEIAEELENWLRFYFRDFLPHVAAEHARPVAAAGSKLRRANAVPCTECRQPVLPIVGEVGLRGEGSGQYAALTGVAS